MKNFSTALVAVIAFLAPLAASAQDATSTTQTQTQITPGTDSPLTPSNNNSSPLTPNTTNPITGQSQSRTVSTAQSSSEVPATLNVVPIEANRVDPSADINLRLAIDPASTSAAMLSPNADGLAPVTAGVSLNSVQGATPFATPQFPLASSASLSSSTSFYPARLTTPGSGSGSSFGGAGLMRSITASIRRSSSTAMGPLVGSAAVVSSSAVATNQLSSAPATSSTFMRSTGSSSIIRPAALSASTQMSSIGPTGLRPGLRGSSSSMFAGRGFAAHTFRSGGHH